MFEGLMEEQLKLAYMTIAELKDQNAKLGDADYKMRRFAKEWGCRLSTVLLRPIICQNQRLLNKVTENPLKISGLVK